MMRASLVVISVAFPPCLLTDRGPEFIEVDRWAEVRAPPGAMIPHTHLARATWTGSVQADPAVMAAACITLASQVPLLFADVTVIAAHVALMFLGLPQSGQRVCDQDK